MTIRPLEVGVLGATGAVGQQFVALLAGHPWFRLAWLGGSERSAGRRYGEVVRWYLDAPLPAEAAALRVEEARPGRAPHLVFSALDAAVAGEIEAAFAAAGHLVVSNARTYRLEPTVPLVVPEVNADHLALADAQAAAPGWAGRLVTNPNCSTIVLALVLAPLRAFGLRRVTVTTLQAVSGAGYPGVPSLDVLANVIPFIAGEEEKIERETRKILGRLAGDRVEPHPVVVSAQATRVPVVDGHVLAVSVGFDASPPLEAVKAALADFRGVPQALGLPSAPASPIVLAPEPDRPQPRRDARAGGGMAVTVGRVRACAVHDVKFVALGHNTIRGAAGAAILNAELLVAQGRAGGVRVAADLASGSRGEAS
jgi:aspartate-semialdehyde dehydrogenase